MTKLRIRLLLPALSLVVASLASAYIQLVDQQNLNNEGLVADPSSIFSQSFTASATSMNTVEVLLYVPRPQSVTVEVSLFAGSGLQTTSLRATSYITIAPADGPIPVEFRFWRPVGLQPGAVYTFSIGSFPRVPFSAQYGSDTYAGGNMFDSTYEYPDRDLYFREGLNVPDPSITRLSNQHLRVQGTAVPGSTVTVSASPVLSADSFVPLGIANVDANGDWQYDDVPTPGLTRRFYRASSP
ncbi:MAG: hypothetical protein M3128_03355 [Verrucomicrobiota bacterium]|nr:hypothetical protein [Verrucomicrobiota bacterium]